MFRLEVIYKGNSHQLSMINVARTSNVESRLRARLLLLSVFTLKVLHYLSFLVI